MLLNLDLRGISEEKFRRLKWFAETKGLKIEKISPEESKYKEIDIFFQTENQVCEFLKRIAEIICEPDPPAEKEKHPKEEIKPNT